MHQTNIFQDYVIKFKWETRNKSGISKFICIVISLLWAAGQHSTAVTRNLL